MKIINSRFLTLYLEQINQYRTGTVSRTSEPVKFAIDQPYLVVWLRNSKDESINVAEENDEKEDDWYLEQYSEKEFNEQSIDNLKTLIVRYNHSIKTQNYTGGKTVRSHASLLIYFDLVEKKVIGHDIINGPGFQNVIGRQGSSDYYNTTSEIIKKIEIHLSVSK